MGIKWNSPEFWGFFVDDWKYGAIDASGKAQLFRQKPSLDFEWGTWSDGSGLGLGMKYFAVDVPSGDQWKTSLIQRPRTWQAADENTPVDAKVWCLMPGIGWLPRYLADTPRRTWREGGTSWSAKGATTNWDCVVLADPKHPDEMPPLDWKPEPC